MNTIFVVATGDALCDESLESMIAASKRWDCALEVMRENASALHPACWKLLVFDKPEIDRVLILDADTLINSICPNPFDAFPPEKMTVVSDRQVHNPARDKAEVDEWEIVTGERKRQPSYFNTGMMVASHVHKSLFNEAFRLCAQFPNLAWHDQTQLNAVMSRHPEVVNYVSETWNFHNPNWRSPKWREMFAYIYHFPGNPDRLKLIPEVQWK